MAHTLPVNHGGVESPKSKICLSLSLSRSLLLLVCFCVCVSIKYICFICQVSIAPQQRLVVIGSSFFFLCLVVLTADRGRPAKKHQDPKPATMGAQRAHTHRQNGRRHRNCWHNITVLSAKHTRVYSLVFVFLCVCLSIFYLSSMICQALYSTPTQKV